MVVHEPGDTFDDVLGALAEQDHPNLKTLFLVLGDSDELLATAARAVVGAREVHAIHIVAPEELDPPRDTLLVADPELPDIRRPMTSEARGEYLATFAAWREDIAHSWSDAGVSFSMAVAGAEEADHLIRRITAPRGMSANA